MKKVVEVNNKKYFVETFTIDEIRRINEALLNEPITEEDLSELIDKSSVVVIREIN